MQLIQRKEGKREIEEGGGKSPAAVMDLPCYIKNEAFAKSPNSRPHNIKQCPSKARNEHTREELQHFSDMWCKKMFRMDVTIKVSALDEEPEQFH